MTAESFKARFLPLHPRLYRIAFAMTGSGSDAEDILQELYCRLWDRRDELAPIRNTEAYCVTLVKHMCLDKLRSCGRRRSEELSGGRFPADGVSPETQAVQRDAVGHLRRLIDRLPENQRQVLRLRGIEGCTFEEIERLTGLSAVNIRVLLSRARKMIREQYQKLTDDD